MEFMNQVQNQLKNKKQIQDWLIHVNINLTDCVIYDDLSVDVQENVNLSNCNISEIPIQFATIDGYFDISDNQLQNLKNSPKVVLGNFFCNNNQLTSLSGSPEYIKGSFECRDNRLNNLLGITQKIGGRVDCRSNHLITLDGIAEKLAGALICCFNKISSLKCAPKIMVSELICNYNPIQITEPIEIDFLHNSQLIHRCKKEEKIKIFDSFYQYQYINTKDYTLRLDGKQFKEVMDKLRIEQESQYFEHSVKLEHNNQKKIKL